MGWVIRGILIVAAIVTSWFIAEDAVKFPIAQMIVALGLLALILAALAFWRRR